MLVSYKQGLLGTEDFFAPEHKAIAAAGEQPMEICSTLQEGSWGYNAQKRHLTTDEAWAKLAAARAANANLLLNTGPMPDGSIPPQHARVLREIGERIRQRRIPPPPATPESHHEEQASLLLLAVPRAARQLPISQAAAAHTNIILILADDLGAKELSCYGSTRHRTPHLDRMAAEGVRFETFYATPLCTPTRVALMTGQYGFHNGFLGMQDPAFKPAPDSPQAQIGNHFTHADLLKSRGYATALAGKWQLSGEAAHAHPRRGLRRIPHVGLRPQPAARHQAPRPREAAAHTCRYWHPCIVENGKYLPTKPEDFGPDLFNDFVIDFARRHKDGPFFVYYTSVLTHGPRVETPDPTKPGARWPAGLKSNLEYLDHLMGKLFAALKAEGLDENTLVIFIGDNGTGGEGKGTVTELGARVPCIIRGPGVKRGRRVARRGRPHRHHAHARRFLRRGAAEGHGLRRPQPRRPCCAARRRSTATGSTATSTTAASCATQRWLLEIAKGGQGRAVLRLRRKPRRHRLQGRDPLDRPRGQSRPRPLRPHPRLDARAQTAARWRSRQRPVHHSAQAAKASRSQRLPCGHASPTDSDHDGASTWFDVAFEVEDLLPGSQHGLSVFDRHSERRSKHCGLQVGVAVAVVPGVLVAVFAAGRQQLVQHRRQVLLEAWFEFNGADGPGAADIEDVHETAAHTRFSYNLSRLPA